MKFTAKALVCAILPVIAFGNMLPVSAQKVVQPSERACRRVITNVGGPEQPRAVAGLNNNQVPVFMEPGDIYGGTASEVLAIGEVVFLTQPQQVLFVNDPQSQNGAGTQMVAFEGKNGKRWMPLADAAVAGGRDGIDRYSAMSKSNLGYCSVRGMW